MIAGQRLPDTDAQVSGENDPVSQSDRFRWDDRYTGDAEVPTAEPGPPAAFAAHAKVFPTSGAALDLACGTGSGSVWLARRGLQVRGLDVSAVAIGRARESAERWAVADRCDFEVADFDHGLPAGPPVAVVLCHLFFDRRLTRAIIARLAPGGLLAIAALSEVGATPGRYRARPGELAGAFAALEPIAAGEGGGRAWLLARARQRSENCPLGESDGP